MLPITYSVQEEATSPRWACAFAAGCGGQAVPVRDTLLPGPLAAFGTPPTWPLFTQAQHERRDWYYGDHAYFGRGRYYRVTKNTYQHDGRGFASPDRFQALGLSIAPWRLTGSAVIVCPNSPPYMQFHGVPADQWLETVTATLCRHTDREIRIRWKTHAAARPLRVDLQDAWAVVAYSSASAIEALLTGVPCFSLAPYAATFRMGLADLTQIETPYYPDDRDQFMANLAAHQWTMEELHRGDAWRVLQDE